MLASMLATKTGALLLTAMATILVLGAAPSTEDPQDAMTRKLLARLDVEKYKATIKGLTQFGDRRQGTARNRAALDWIEAQLKSYGCSNVERLTYTYTPRARGATGAGGATGARRARDASGSFSRCFCTEVTLA